MSREMKHSGIEWIGEIPKEWNVMSIKHYCNSIYAGGTPQSNKSEYWDGDIPWIPSGSCKNCIIESAPKYITQQGLENSSTKLISSGTTVMAMTGATCSNVGFVTFDTCMNQSVVAYIENKEKTISKFLFYLLQGAQEDILTHKTGGAQSGINVDDCKNIVVPYVPLIEQQKIANYLDKVCGEVDEMIALQEQMIEELKAYKQSVITEAVTKGLNPDVPMKDSGIDWIGEVPEHWNHIKLGLLFQFKGGYAFNSDKYVPDSNNQVIRIGNVKNNLLLLDTSPVYVDDETANIAKKYELKPGCILFTMTGTKGKRDYFYTLLLKESDFCKKLYLNQRVGCFIAKMDICPNYYNYLLKDNRILDQVFLYETGTANQGNLGIESISRTMLHLPPLDEQQSIASYLDTKCAEIDALIAIKQMKIEELKEYKKSVIYEYVTGKKEVV